MPAVLHFRNKRLQGRSQRWKNLLGVMLSKPMNRGHGRLLRRQFLHLALFAPIACRSSNERSREHRGKIRLGFKHQPLGSNPGPLRDLIASYEQKHPGVQIVGEALPNASDVAHQYFLTALEGGAGHFDVFVVDVIWTAEFARAGWIADLSPAFPSEVIRRDFLPGLADSAVIEGRTFAVPWYVDVGLLYYRRDLVPGAPRTYEQLEQFTLQALRTNPQLQGYLWQGRQYEGLVCNVLEAIWGHRGSVWSDGRLRFESPEARAALGYLRSLLIQRISPASVRSAAEEDSRRVFQNGGAVFMRNWPYAWNEVQRENSAVRDKVGVASVPTLSGEPGHGTLGGWHLALNARSPERNRAAAIQLIEHLTSLESNLSIALAYGRNPPRRETYLDPRLAKVAPSIHALLPILETARSRPATPYYNLLSDALQSEFSAAIAGIRAPEMALRNAQRHVDRITAQAS